MRKRLFAGILTLALLGGFPVLIYRAAGYERGHVAGALVRAALTEARLDATERRRLLDLVIATLVGETTAGGAHAGVFHRIDDHFGVAIPQVRSVNPFGKADWEGVGVEPDMRVKAANALETAVKIAEAKLQNQRQSR